TGWWLFSPSSTVWSVAWGPRPTATPPRPSFVFPPELGLRVRAWQSLSPLGPGTLDRGSFRVELEDGATVKVRRVGDEARAEKAFALLSNLALEGFPRPLARHGRHLVEPWIESLDGPVPVAEAGRMLARLHAA